MTEKWINHTNWDKWLVDGLPTHCSMSNDMLEDNIEEIMEWICKVVPHARCTFFPDHEKEDHTMLYFTIVTENHDWNTFI